MPPLSIHQVSELICKELIFKKLQITPFQVDAAIIGLTIAIILILVRNSAIFTSFLFGVMGYFYHTWMLKSRLVKKKWLDYLDGGEDSSQNFQQIQDQGVRSEKIIEIVVEYLFDILKIFGVESCVLREHCVREIEV